VPNVNECFAAKTRRFIRVFDFKFFQSGQNVHLGFSSQIYIWVDGKGKVKRFGVRFAARLAKLRRFYVWLAVNRFSFAACGWY
jgi:hypothetical protein